MKEINATKKYFDNYRYDSSLSAESNRYYNDDEFIKIIHKRLLKDDRELVVKGLCNFENESLATPIYIINDHDKFIGYAMKYLKDYKNISNHFENEDTTFDERKELMIRLSKVFDYFDKMKFAYHDVHSDNIMYKDGDIKLIDLDGGVLYPYINDGYNYNTALRLAKKNLTKYTLATINGYSIDGLLELKKKKYRKLLYSYLRKLPPHVRVLYEYAFSNNYSVLYGITEGLSEITESMSDDANEILERRLY